MKLVLIGLGLRNVVMEIWIQLNFKHEQMSVNVCYEKILNKCWVYCPTNMLNVGS